MKNISLVATLLLFSFFSVAQNLNGRYEGAVSRDGSVQLVNFDFYVENGIQKGTYEIPEVGYYDVPITDIQWVNDTLHVQFYYGNFFCSVREDTKEITGLSEKWNPKIRLHVKRTQPKEKPYTREDIVFENGETTLSGMVYTPRHGFKGEVKYVILVHGSGIQDRYSPYYISLGHALSCHGIGVLLYDKRGSGKSSGDLSKASMHDLAEDAVAAYNYLVNQLKNEDIKIGFLGTSQGGWVAPLAANKVTQCDFLVLNVGPSVSVFTQEINRVEYSMKADGWEPSAINDALEYSSLYLQYVRDHNPNKWSELSALVAEIKDKKWVGYVNIPENENEFNWWRLNDHNPAETLKSLKCRTLSLYGEFDPLVPPEENAALMTQYLKDAKVPHEVKVIRGVIHDMKTFQGLNGDNWNWPEVYWNWRAEPEAFMQTIIKFIKDDAF